MNSKLAFIFARRSVRAYAAKPIPAAMIDDLLTAAMAAPSACCKDPWHFIVVVDKAALQRISAGLPNGRMLADAGAGIVVCGHLEEAHDRQLSYLLQDCSAAIENLLIAAAALGLGTCWLGVHPREDRMAHIRKTLAIPDAVIPVGVVSVGWPQATPEPRTRYDKRKVHAEKW